MNSKLLECWTICITCGRDKRRNRVAPADPIPVVCTFDDKQVDQDNKSESRNGQINQNFVPDDNSVNNVPRGESLDQIVNDAVDSSAKIKAGYGQPFATVVFIETGKDKQLRVVHVKPSHENNANPAEPKTELPHDDVAEERKATTPSSEVDEEEEEYWFSKWSRKPRLRSIFEKSTIHQKYNENAVESESDLMNSKDVGNRNWSSLPPDGEVTTEAQDSIRWTKCPNPNPSSETDVDSPSVKFNIQQQQREKNEESEENEEPHSYTNLGFEEEDDRIEPTDLVDPNDIVLKVSEETEITESNSRSSTFKCQSIGPECESPKEIHTEVTLTNQTPTSNGKIQEDNIAVLELPSSRKIPVLFFIHGISGSSDIWKSQIDFFQKLGYEMVVPDILGHGLSSTPSQPKHYLFESLVQDLICVFDYYIHDDMKCVIIGHGYGACLGTVLSRIRPKNVSLLISISGGGPTPLVRPQCCQNSWMPFHSLLYHRNKVMGRFDNPELKHVLPTNIRENMLKGQLWEEGDSAFHRRIPIPTLLVYGMRDKVVNLVEECEMEKTIPRAFLEIIHSAGHMIMWDEPNKLNRMLGKFIQSWS